MNFTKNFIIDLAKLASISYKTGDQIKETFYSRPINKTSNDSVFYRCSMPPKLYSCGRDSQMYVCMMDDTLSITFRGTESGRDVLTDLNCILVELPLENVKDSEYPCVHWGFHNQFEELKPDLDKILKDYYDSSATIEKRVVFSGHSLGGGLATISAVNYAYLYRDIVVDCVTFGSPRVGNPKFVEYFNKGINKSYRFVNDNDPIPCLPTAWRYKHVKGCKWIHNDKIKEEITAWRGWRFIKNYLLSFIGYGYDASNDHSCDVYIHDLEYLPEEN
jgi:hypothetical protein